MAAFDRRHVLKYLLVNSLSKRLYEAWTEVGGIAEYHLLAPFEEDGHFLVDDPDAVPVWSPIVMKFLGRHPWNGFATK